MHDIHRSPGSPSLSPDDLNPYAERHEQAVRLADIGWMDQYRRNDGRDRAQD